MLAIVTSLAGGSWLGGSDPKPRFGDATITVAWHTIRDRSRGAAAHPAGGPDLARERSRERTMRL